jgi:hypothetical protein
LEALTKTKDQTEIAIRPQNILAKSKNLFSFLIPEIDRIKFVSDKNI